MINIVHALISLQPLWNVQYLFSTRNNSRRGSGRRNKIAFVNWDIYIENLNELIRKAFVNRSRVKLGSRLYI